MILAISKIFLSATGVVMPAETPTSTRDQKRAILRALTFRRNLASSQLSTTKAQSTNHENINQSARHLLGGLALSPGRTWIGSCCVICISSCSGGLEGKQGGEFAVRGAHYIFSRSRSEQSSDTLAFFLPLINATAPQHITCRYLRSLAPPPPAAPSPVTASSTLTMTLIGPAPTSSNNRLFTLLAQPGQFGPEVSA